MSAKSIQLSAIRIDGGTQSREALNQATVAEYAEAMTEGATFPPVTLFFDGSNHWLADGFHRYFAAKQVGFTDMPAEVRDGTQLDAQWASYTVNKDHGLRRSNADKRKAVMGALAHPYGKAKSDNQIAKELGVHHSTVGDIRRSLADSASDKPAERTYTTKHGTTAVMNTTNVGKKTKAEKAKPPFETEPSSDSQADAPAEVEPEIEAPPDYTELDAADEYTELDALADQVRDLQAEVARLKLLVPAEADEGNDMLKEMQHEMATLRQANKAITIARDRFQAENAELKRQCVWLKKQLDKQK